MIVILRRLGKILLDIVEIYIPCISFSIMFLSFMIQIFTRYVLNNPQVWAYEVTIFGFLWTALLGALYAKRKGVHVKFTLLYDVFSPFTRTWIRIIGNSLILISFIIGLWPALDYVMFMGFRKSTVLMIPYDIVFFPFIIFLLVMIGRLSVDVFQDIRMLTNKSEVSV